MWKNARALACVDRIKTQKQPTHTPDRRNDGEAVVIFFPVHRSCCYVIMNMVFFWVRRVDKTAMPPNGESGKTFAVERQVNGGNWVISGCVCVCGTNVLQMLCNDATSLFEIIAACRSCARTQ